MSHSYLPWQLFPDWDNDSDVCDHGFNNMSIATGDNDFKTKSCYQLQQSSMSSSYVKPKCKVRIDDDCARWFPYFASLSVIRDEGLSCKSSKVHLIDFPAHHARDELFVQARDVVLESGTCTHNKSECIPEVVFHWRDEERVKSYGPIPHSEECDVIHKSDFKISTHVFVSTLDQSLLDVNSFGAMKHSQVLFSIAEGHRTKMSGFVYNRKLQGKYDVSKDLTLGAVNWFDVRLRSCRLSEDKCRDCSLASSFCRMH